MGVITEFDIDYGRIFGPFPSFQNIHPSNFIGYLTTDTLNDTHKITIDVRDEQNTSAMLEWLPYIQPSRTEEEQNMEAYMKDDRKVYYRTLRIIRAKETLFVWYSKDFAQILGIPALKWSYATDPNMVYYCELCGEKFKFPYPYLAHVRFQCNGRDRLNGVRCLEHTNTPASYTSRVPDKAIIDVWNVTSDKRKPDHETTENSPKKKLVKRYKSFLDKSHSEQLDRSFPADCDIKEALSAFRKVKNGHFNENDGSNSGNYSNQEHMEQLRVLQSTLTPPETKVVHSKSLVSLNNLDNGGVNNIGMLFASNLMRSAANMGLQFPVNDASPYGYLVTQRGNLRNNDLNVGRVGNGVLDKQLFVEEFYKYQFPVTRSNNPMIEKMLENAPSPTMTYPPLIASIMSQNWCAKCNASFRMTSDLVYHMRSHHKREFDPVKKKRDDKLKCKVCEETFKERHHLTRHMSAHA